MPENAGRNGARNGLTSLAATARLPRQPGALVLEEGPSKAVMAALGVAATESTPDSDRPELGADALAHLGQLASLDDPRVSQRRREQSALRRLKMRGRAVAACSICGESFPASLLIAAHIKPRADASHAERLDHEHNVLLACLLGCDALFERGFIVVKNGRIHPGPAAPATTSVQTRVTYLLGRACAAWGDRSK